MIEDIEKESDSHYSALEIERWQSGGQAYAEFFSHLNDDKKRELIHLSKTMHPHNPGNVQLLFLGEKPVVFELYVSESLAKKFQASGYKTSGNYIYDPLAVLQIINQHSKLFAEYATTDPQVLMEKFSKKQITECHNQRGILLGYPSSAVEYFLSEERAQFFDFIERKREELIAPIRDSARTMEYKKREVAEKVNWEFLLITDILKGYVESDPHNEEWQTLLTSAQKFCSLRTFGIPNLGDEWVDVLDSAESIEQEKRWKEAINVSHIAELYPPEKWPQENHLTDEIQKSIHSTLVNLKSS